MANKGFRVDVDAARNLIYLKVWGLWDEADGEAYVRAFAEKSLPMQGKDFDIIADISEFPAQRAEVNAAIQQTMVTAVERGMKRAANVVSSAMTQLQIKRLSEETGLPVFSFFKSVAEAEAWLGKAR